MNEFKLWDRVIHLDYGIGTVVISDNYDMAGYMIDWDDKSSDHPKYISQYSVRPSELTVLTFMR